LSEEHKRHIGEAVSGENNGFYGRHHSEETKIMMRANRKDVSGENNSFYGKC
jgi:hypothetical protein